MSVGQIATEKDDTKRFNTEVVLKKLATDRAFVAAFGVMVEFG